MTHRQRLFLNLFYLLIAIWIWTLLFRAQYQPYDSNIAYALSALGISAVVFTTLTILAFRRKSLLRDNYHASLIFLLTRSPVTIGLVVFNYGSLFGRMLDQ